MSAQLFAPSLIAIQKLAYQTDAQQSLQKFTGEAHRGTPVPCCRYKELLCGWVCRLLTKPIFLRTSLLYLDLSTAYWDHLTRVLRLVTLWSFLLALCLCLNLLTASIALGSVATSLLHLGDGTVNIQRLIKLCDNFVIKLHTSYLFRIYSVIYCHVNQQLPLILTMQNIKRPCYLFLKDSYVRITWIFLHLPHFWGT